MTKLGNKIVDPFKFSLEVNIILTCVDEYADIITLDDVDDDELYDYS